MICYHKLRNLSRFFVKKIQTHHLRCVCIRIAAAYSKRPLSTISLSRSATWPLANNASISRFSSRTSRSASAPTATQPLTPVLPSSSAGVEVSSLIASSNGRPRRTRLLIVRCRYLGEQ